MARIKIGDSKKEKLSVILLIAGVVSASIDNPTIWALYFIVLGFNLKL